MCKQIEMDCNISLQWRWRRGLLALSFVVKRESEVDAYEELEPVLLSRCTGMYPALWVYFWHCEG